VQQHCRHGAQAGLADRIGTLQPGKYADIVPVAGNPLASIDATEHPVFVMKQGVIYVAGPASSSL
jgi:imidazolonepropionase-like amidohydrolase